MAKSDPNREVHRRIRELRARAQQLRAKEREVLGRNEPNTVGQDEVDLRVSHEGTGVSVFYTHHHSESLATGAGGEELETGFVDEDARGHDVMDEKAADAIGEQLVTGLAAKASDEFRRDLENRVLKPWPGKLVRSRIERKATSSDDDWLVHLGPCIPNPWREGWLHDILEDREHWRAEGLTRRKTAFRTTVQFTNAMIFNPRTWFVGAFTWIVSKMNGPWFGG